MLSGFFGSDDLFLAAGKSPSGVPKDIQYVEDKYFGCGPLAGLHAALGRAKHDILFVTSCDMPLVDHRTADALLPLFGGHDAVVPKTACGKYHPLTAPLSPWQNVDLQRDEVPTGAALFSAGEPLTPAHIGVLAAQGIDKVDVFRRPKAYCPLALSLCRPAARRHRAGYTTPICISFAACCCARAIKSTGALRCRTMRCRSVTRLGILPRAMI